VPRAGSRGCRGSNRAVAVLVSTLLAASASLAGTPPALAGTSSAAPPASVAPPAVAAALGVNGISAELVVLVDISLSMSASRHGPYPQLEQELSAFLGTLAKQEPQDTVGVVVFGAPADTEPVYLGPPTSAISLPGDATGQGTDFGAAFNVAVNMLSEAPANVQVGGVLLLSDGKLNAPSDTDYDGGRAYHAPGWAKLRARVQALHMTVTGYGLPLTPSRTDLDGVSQALGAVFSQNQILGTDVADLGGELGLAQQRIRDEKVASAAQPDSGRGVRVTWDKLPGADGMSALSLASGHASARVTLTATTLRVPLTLTGLTVTSRGLPVVMTGTLPSTSAELAPGHSMSLPVHLTWQPTASGLSLTGGMREAQGQLALTAHVSSPYSPAIRDSFGDAAFSVGGVTGGTSASFAATIPAAVSVLLLVLIIVVILVLLAGFAAFRARLGGTLTLTSVDDVSGSLSLPRRPWLSARTDGLIGIPGRMTVRGTLLKHQMRVRLQLLDRPDGEAELTPGGRTMVAGIDIVHDPSANGAYPEFGRW
jgi:Mg-chelatase subunit ChlD